jgi:hypothetical protein
MLVDGSLMRTVSGTAVGLLVLGACSDSADSLAPGAGNQAGTGTGTLTVDGIVLASPNRFNASANGDFETEFSVRVLRGNQAVANGTVTIATATGKIPLTYESGRWRGTAPIYDEVYVLDIASGADRVDEVRIDGPDVHKFTEPAAGATVPGAMPVTIKWKRGDEADSAAVRTETIDWIAIPDAGSFALPAGSFRPDTTKPVMHTLRLARTNRVVPAGATAGSTWSVTIENQLDVNTDPQPRL